MFLSAAERIRAVHAREHGVTARVMRRSPSYRMLAERCGAGERVLEVGCAEGTLLELIAARGAQGIGVDLWPTAGAVAADAASLPFADAAFDRVVSHLTLMLIEDLDRAAHELARVLRPGGTLHAIVGGGPPAGDTEAFALGLDVLARCRPPDVPSFRVVDRGSPERHRANREDGWRSVFTPHGLTVTGFDRVVADLSGSLNEVTALVMSGYDVATWPDDARVHAEGEVRTALQLRWPVATVIPCAMVLWVATAHRE